MNTHVFNNETPSLIINSTRGHAEDSRVLKLIFGVFTDAAERNNAISFRNGGDEFVIITDRADGFLYGSKRKHKSI